MDQVVTTVEVKPKASFVIRGAAIIFDTLIILLPLALISLLIKKEALSLLGNLYNWLMIANGGATLGKKFFGIKVVDTHDGKIGLGKSFLREILGKIISSLVFSLGYFWALWDKDKQTWHDKIAGTYVIQDREISNGKKLFANLLFWSMPILAFLSIIATIILIAINPQKQLYKAQKLKADQEAQAQISAAPKAIKPTLEEIKALFSQDLIKFGDANRKNLFVVVIDPSDPFSHIISGTNPEMAKSRGDKFSYTSDGGTFVPPLTEIRKLIASNEASLVLLYNDGAGYGTLAMQSLYCAYDQNIFWPVYDKLMTNSGYLLTKEIKNDPANKQKLLDFLSVVNDTKPFTDCIQSGSRAAHLYLDQELAKSLGILGTPGFFVNDQKFSGTYSWPVMSSALIN